MSHHAILGQSGAIAKLLPGYEARPQQLEMADAVARAIQNKAHLLVEAGTGTGKSFAYLVPAIQAALKNPECKVVISTHTIGLQEQLIAKDIPFLQKAFAVPIKVTLVKGRGNYLSKRRLQIAQQKANTLLDDRRDVDELQEIARWDRRTSDGSRSDLAFKPRPPVWDLVESDSANCLGKKCPTYEKCFFFKARQGIQAAHLLIVNHALFFTDLAVKSQGESKGFLPKYQVVVFDEAHTIEDVAADHLGLSISRGQCDFLLNKLLHERKGAQHGLLSTRSSEAALRQHGKTLLAVRDLFDSIEIWRLGQAKGKPGGDMIRVRQSGIVATTAAADFARLGVEIVAFAQHIAAPEEKIEYTAAADRCQHLADQIQSWLGQKLPDQAYWIEGAPNKPNRLTLASAPIEVGPILREQLFDKVPTAILTSATLSVGGGKSGFEHIRKRLGFSTGETLQLGSPFNYPEQVDLHLFRNMPDPSARDFEAASISKIREAIDKSGGRAFVLFTSFTAMTNAANQLRPWLAQQGYEFYSQSDGIPAAQMLQRFREARSAVLFGVDTFWQGVDIQGESLSNVIIPKLPFTPPGRPLFEARGEAITARGGDSFMELSLPHAIIKLKQGFGRLIRTKSDRGMVAILDPRMLTKRYGRSFLDALPPCRRYIDGEEVE